jgi:integrase
MPAQNRLTAVAAKNACMGKHHDGGGLYLIVEQSDSARWAYRYKLNKKDRWMGLGGYPLITLAAAREMRDTWRLVLKRGEDPIKERGRQRREANRSDTSLRAVAEEAFEARKAELKGDGKAGRWFSPLEHHILPKLGATPIGEIDQTDVRDALAPIWHIKSDVARKALNRLSIVLKHATAMGLDVDLQATAKARVLLGQSRHVAKRIPSMPWVEVPAFYSTLGCDTRSHLALRLLILTGARSANIRSLRLEEVDGDVWTIPAESRKGRKGKTSAFAVPLSAEARHVIELAKAFCQNGFLFANERGSVLSDVALTKPLKAAGLNARPHGFRSSLRNWLAETTNAPHEVAEAMLAHVTDGQVVRAYRTTDFLEQRRVLSERWTGHVTGRSGEILKLAEA